MNIEVNSNADRIKSAIYRQQAVEYNRIVDEVAKQFWPKIGTANHIAFQAIDDAVEMMTDCGMMRQKVKVHAQKAIVEYHRYEFATWQHFKIMNDGRFALWQDLIGRAAVKMEPDIQKLHYSIKQVLDREHVENSEVMAQIQTGLALVTLSTMMFDILMESYQCHTMIDVAGMFMAGRLTAVERHWREVGEITGKQVMADVNLRDDKTCQLAVRVILERYQRADILNEAAGEALRLNPDVKVYVNEEDKSLFGNGKETE